MKTQVNLYLISYWVDGKSCRENRNTHFRSNTFFSSSCDSLDDYKKCGRARQVVDDQT